MNKNKNRYLPLILSLMWLTATAVMLIIFYTLTRYLPLLLGGMTILLPALIYAALALFCNGAAPALEPEDIPEVINESETGNKATRFAAKLSRIAKRFGEWISRVYFKSRNIAAAVLTVLITAGAHLIFWIMMRRSTTLYTMNYLFPVLLAVVFVTYIIFEKWCAHAVTGDDSRAAAHLRNVRSAFMLGRVVLVLIAAACVVKLLGLWEALPWLNIVLAVLFCYGTVMMLMSMAVKVIRREMVDDPDASIPMPFSGNGHKDMGVMGYLEKNTGITMRSLWSIQFIKKMVPYALIISVALLWLCSGIVQVEAYQAGAVYRLGKLQDEPLSPGLHMTLPWPFDKVRVYDTETISSTTIGYLSSTRTDNIWTATHGTEEYRLLLGGGNELVSINLRLEYRIGDVISYLRSCSSPEKLLEAKAYELVTDLTISTDLDALLSVDRAAFVNDFRDRLETAMNEYDTGIVLEDVILESIHPPVDIAETYHSIVSAEIKAEQYILDAEATAAVKIADAQKQYDTSLNAARADSYAKIAAAEADVAEFMASVSADNTYQDTYRYYKYLRAIGLAYGKSKLVIVGEGIDSSNIYFGNLSVTE